MPVGSVDGAIGPPADVEAGHFEAAAEIQTVVLGKAVLQIFDGYLHGRWGLCIIIPCPQKILSYLLPSSFFLRSPEKPTPIYIYSIIYKNQALAMPEMFIPSNACATD